MRPFSTNTVLRRNSPTSSHLPSPNSAVQDTLANVQPLNPSTSGKKTASPTFSVPSSMSLVPISIPSSMRTSHPIKLAHSSPASSRSSTISVQASPVSTWNVDGLLLANATARHVPEMITSLPLSVPSQRWREERQPCFRLRTICGSSPVILTASSSGALFIFSQTRSLIRPTIS